MRPAAGDARAHSAAVMIEHPRRPSGTRATTYREPDWSIARRHPEPRAALLRQKHHARHGRKMAHFTVLDSDLDRAVNIAMEARAAIGIPRMSDNAEIVAPSNR